MESEELIKVFKRVSDLLLMMGKNDLIVNNENRRVVISDFFEILIQNNQIGQYKILDESHIIKI